MTRALYHDTYDDGYYGTTMGSLGMGFFGNDVDPNSAPSAGQAVDAGQDVAPGDPSAPSPSVGGFPSFAGSPSIFMGRVVKFNQVNGTNFAVNTPPLDPSLDAAVSDYQSARGLTADGEMGPKTEAQLDADIAASGGGAAPVPQLPGAPAAPGGQIQPASAQTTPASNTKMILAVGLGAVALLGLAYYATK